MAIVELSVVEANSDVFPFTILDQFRVPMKFPRPGARVLALLERIQKEQQKKELTHTGCPD